MRGTGKRGGARVIYFFRDLNMPLYLISVYKKSEKSTLSEVEKRKIRKLIEELIDAHSKAWEHVVRDRLA
jgi:hypothetical protein